MKYKNIWYDFVQRCNKNLNPDYLDLMNNLAVYVKQLGEL